MDHLNRYDDSTVRPSYATQYWIYCHPDLMPTFCQKRISLHVNTLPISPPWPSAICHPQSPCHGSPKIILAFIIPFINRPHLSGYVAFNRCISLTHPELPHSIWNKPKVALYELNEGPTVRRHTVWSVPYCSKSNVTNTPLTSFVFNSLIDAIWTGTEAYRIDFTDSN